MALTQPHPSLDEPLAGMSEAGLRVSAIEAGAGEVCRPFPAQAAAALAGKLVSVTGSGRPLRDIHHDPTANLGVAATGPDRLFQRPTSELNSHLAVRNDQMARSGTNLHAQPPHLADRQAHHPGVIR